MAYTALRIASKLEERFNPDIQSLNSSNVDNFHLNIQFLIFLFTDLVSYPIDDYHTLEFIVGNLFSWEFNVPIANTFRPYFSEFIVDEEDFDKHKGHYENIHTMKQNLSENAFHWLEIIHFSK